VGDVTATGIAHRWRPSMFAPSVAHLTADGQQPRTSDEYPGERWVHGRCRQRVEPDREEIPGSHRCPECLTWLRAQHDAGRPVTVAS
jgi:hypothetical protein